MKGVIGNPVHPPKPTRTPTHWEIILFRRIWTTAVLPATALGFAAATAGPAAAGLQTNHREPLVRR